MRVATSSTCLPRQDVMGSCLDLLAGRSGLVKWLSGIAEGRGKVQGWGGPCLVLAQRQHVVF